jgi:long-chain acyl-CoA synthetase
VFFNLAVMVREAARQRPTKPCVLAGDGKVLSFADLDAGSAAIAGGLRDRGLRAGDRVVLQLPNGSDFVEAYFAVLRAGMVAVPINPLLKAREIVHVLDDSGASLLITHARCLDEAQAALSQRSQTRLAIAGGPGPDAINGFGALRRAGASSDVAPTAGEDTAVLIYTSGTTGRPKGAELSHTQLFMSCSLASEMVGIGADDIALTALPLFHVFGLSSVLHTAVRRMTTLVLVDRFQPEEVLERLRAHGVTIFYGVPTMFVSMLESLARGARLESLRIAFSGGAAIPEEVVRRFEQHVGGVVLEGYGLSETGSTTTLNTSPENRRLLSVGRPLWGVEVRIEDDHGLPLPPGRSAIGEVLVRGHNVMKGYFRDPRATTEAVRGGWLHTGDLGYLDDDGYLFIVDRKKELIIRGGYNVYPREVEEVLYLHPAVAEAAVVGTTDDRLGEEVRAYVSLRAGAQVELEELIEHCRGRLAAYKYPRQVVFLDELPKGPSGKILKRELREAVA